MPSRRWIIDPALVITTLVCVGILFAVAFDYAYLIGKQDAAEGAESATDADHTKRHIDEVCSSLSGLPWRECALDAIQPHHEQSQDTRDLQAQEWMARWAFWMFFTAFAGTAVAAYGLVLLRSTWAETKRTADIAREIGQAEVRAYVSPVSVETVRDDIETSVKISIRNSGASPARRVRVKIVATVYLAGEFLGQQQRIFWHKMERDDADIASQEARTYNIPIDCDHDDRFKTYEGHERMGFSVIGVIMYSDVFAKNTMDVHFSNFEFTVPRFFKLEPQDIPVVGHSSREITPPRPDSGGQG